MKGLIIVLFVAVIGVFGQNYGQINSKFGERLGPEYPQPGTPVVIPKVEEVLPRLGAVAVSIDEVSYIFGGLAYLPNNWPAAFSNIHSLAQEYAVSELNAFDHFGNKFIYQSADGFEGMSNKRAFPIAERISATEFIVWGGGSENIEKFSSTSGKFVDVEVTGNEPESTYGAASAFDLDENVVVFGGMKADGDLSNEINVFNVLTSTWTAYNPSVAPSARYGSSLTFIGNNTFFLYGGVTEEGLNGEFWIFNLGDGSWEQQFYNTSILAENEEEADSARAFHVAVVNEDGIYFILGETNNKKSSLAFVIFEYDAFVVVNVPSNYRFPPVRSGFAHSISYEKSSIQIFGGVRDLNRFIETKSLNAEVYFIYLDEDSSVIRSKCYPGFVFDDIINVCALPTPQKCSLCETCTDLKSFKKGYVNNLKNKAIQKDYTGILQQCVKSA